MLAARDARPDVERPRMVLPTTAHAAFHKAAHYFGVEPVVVDVDPVTMRADPEAMAAAIDDDTVLVVASAPSYAHGVIDPVEPIAAARRGARRPVPRRRLHRRLGAAAPATDAAAPWTFAVEGVTSVSSTCTSTPTPPRASRSCSTARPRCAATHLFASADWPGYTMLNTTMQSTKSGGPLAAAWAVVHHIGEDGYAGLARQARAATLALAARGRRGIPGLSVAGAAGLDARSR